MGQGVSNPGRCLFPERAPRRLAGERVGLPKIGGWPALATFQWLSAPREGHPGHASRRLSIDRGNEGAELLSYRFPTPIETREQGVRRALLGWPADSRLAWRRRAELFAKAS